jgi:hypothetical protein
VVEIGRSQTGVDPIWGRGDPDSITRTDIELWQELIQQHARAPNSVVSA